MSWEITKRRDNDFIVHREGELRGICQAYSETDANRIADALNQTEEKENAS